MKKIASAEQLRRICQEPVRARNDISGALYGQRVSIHVTRLLLALGLSPSFASSMMFVCGVGGSLLMLFPGGWRVAGLAVLAFAYVLDCVDGEMARFHRIDSMRWAAFDLLHHMVMKGLAFLCLGIGLWLEFDEPLAVAAGGLLSVVWLLLNGVRDMAPLLFSKKVVLDDERLGNPAYQRLRASLDRLEEPRGAPGNGHGATRVATAAVARAEPHADIWGRDFQFRPWMVRTFFCTFDIVVLLFLAAAIAQRFLPVHEVLGRAMPLETMLLFAYAIVLPLHALDCIVTALRRGGPTRDQLLDLARRVQRFRDAP